MSCPETDGAWAWVRYFLEVHLPRHRGVSPHTLLSYRAAFRQLRKYLFERWGPTRSRRLQLDDLQPQLLLDFLAWLESPQGGQVCASTRNVRLAALRGFFRCLELYCRTEDRARWERLRHLPQKRASGRTAQHLDQREVDCVFSQINLSRPEGFRDLALLAVLYNTGARVSEVAGLCRPDLNLGDSPSLRLRGKGRRERRCPVWLSTASLLRRYLEEFRPASSGSAFVFLNQRGQQLTRHGIGRRVVRYIQLASQIMPSLSSKRLSVHSFRHTTAIHLLESGAEMHVIKAWLGHRSTRSTDHYLDLNLLPQRELLARFAPPPRLGDEVLSEFDDDPESWLDRP